jgi:aldehyde dehydrogenase (NAD+)
LPETGCFFAPTLAIDVDPSSVLAQEEIFGPVAATMTFRTPSEALELANNTMYGLAASVWSENINQALHLAPSLQAGVVWVNCTNQFDAACGFGGYRESGFGREGGREGLLEYMKPKVTAFTGKKLKRPDVQGLGHTTTLVGSEIHRTAKFFIAGKQARPDGGMVRPVWNKDGSLAGTVGQGNRKDLRNAVEAAQKASSWSKSSGHLRAQILFYFAENLSLRRQELESRLQQLLGCKSNEAQQEVDSSIQRCFHYAAWADKFEGVLHQPPQGLLVPVLNEPLGVIGLICPDENPLLSFLSILLPSLAAGNRSIVIPSPSYPLIANDLIQVMETSDIPAGAVNLISGNPAEMIQTLAAHENLDGIWVFGTEEEVRQAKRLSTSNLKRVWGNEGQVVDWHSPLAQGREWLRQASQSKNIWIPFGE